MNKKKIEEWKIIDSYREPISTVGNWFSGYRIYEKIVYVQQNIKTGEIRKI